MDYRCKLKYQYRGFGVRWPALMAHSGFLMVFQATAKGTMWITVAQRSTRDETPQLFFEKAKFDTLGWDYTAYHHMDCYLDGHNHNRVVAIEAFIARHGTGAILTEEDQQSLDRKTIGSSSDGNSASTPEWLRAMMSTRLAIKAAAQSTVNEITEIGKCKSWDEYVS